MTAMGLTFYMPGVLGSLYFFSVLGVLYQIGISEMKAVHNESPKRYRPLWKLAVISFFWPITAWFFFTPSPLRTTVVGTGGPGRMRSAWNPVRVPEEARRRHNEDWDLPDAPSEAWRHP